MFISYYHRQNILYLYILIWISKYKNKGPINNIIIIKIIMWVVHHIKANNNKVVIKIIVLWLLLLLHYLYNINHLSLVAILHNWCVLSNAI